MTDERAPWMRPTSAKSVYGYEYESVRHDDPVMLLELAKPVLGMTTCQDPVYQQDSTRAGRTPRLPSSQDLKTQDLWIYWALRLFSTAWAVTKALRMAAALESSRYPGMTSQTKLQKK